MKWPLFASLLGALATSLACHHPDKAPASAVGAEMESWLSGVAPKVEAQPLQLHELHATIGTSGRVAYDDAQVSHVFSPVTGRVVEIHAQPGQRVHQGATLATILSPDMGVASSDVDKAQATLHASEADFKRKKVLFDAGAAAQQDLETAADAYEVAIAELQRAQEVSRLLSGSRGDPNHVRSMYQLVAPIAGEVVNRYVNPGMEITGQYQSGSGTELFTVANLDEVWVMADIYEVDVGRVQPGLAVQLHVESYPEREFSGTVDWVSDVLDPVARTARLRCIVKNNDGLLKPDMFAAVNIVSRGKPTLTVPRRSIVHLGEKTVVFVQTGKNEAGDLRVVRRPVVVDEAEEGDLVPVLHGLDLGEMVITQGVDLVASRM